MRIAVSRISALPNAGTSLKTGRNNTQQVKRLYELRIVDSSFIGLDSTPIAANTKQNNPKSFVKYKFSKENHPVSDVDCALGVHTASNRHNEKNYEFYWGYKNHILVDCISGLPLYELTTPANRTDASVTESILSSATVERVHFYCR